MKDTNYDARLRIWREAEDLGLIAEKDGRDVRVFAFDEIN